MMKDYKNELESKIKEISNLSLIPKENQNDFGAETFINYNFCLLEYNLIDKNLISKISKNISVDIFLIILTKLEENIEKLINEITKNSTKEDIETTSKKIISQINFLFIILNNTPKKNLKAFYEYFFKSKLINTLKKILEKYKLKDKSILYLNKIIISIFIKECQNVIQELNDENLKNLYFTIMKNYTNIFHIPLPECDDKTYENFFVEVNKEDFQYDFLDNLIEDKNELARTLINIIFSNEKNKYINFNENFEYDIVSKIVAINMRETKKKMGDKYKALFRADNTTNEIIKHLFFLFGNEFYIKSFVQSFKKYFANHKTEIKIQRSYFENFINEVIKNMNENEIPIEIIFIMRIIDEKVKQFFTIEETNYAPMLTGLFFLFFLSPKIQNIYSILPVDKLKILGNVNRIILNMCNNNLFRAGDEFEDYNEIIPKYNLKLIDFLQKKILTVDFMKYIRSKKYINLPRLIFIENCNYIIRKFGIKVDIFEDFDNMEIK